MRKFTKTVLAGALVFSMLGCSQTLQPTENNTNEPVEESAVQPISPVYVNVKPGTLLGMEDNGLYSFKGIPYATAERFQSPKPVTEYPNGFQTALTYGTVSPQERGMNGTGTINPYEFVTPSNGTADMVMNENCQNLNVWTNSLEGKKPVLVFFHGGGLEAGASSELSAYDGSYFAREYDSVFVSVNHRLNALGFLDVSKYGEEYKDSGIVGIQDCVEALKWVQDNIEAFGGDPENVTILGQSGGGFKVTTLACMSDTVDLFDKVFVMSGHYITSTKEEGLANTQLLVDALGVPEDKVIDTLTSMSYEELITTAYQAGRTWYNRTGNGTYQTPLFDSETGKMNEYAAQRKWIWGTTFSEFNSTAVDLAWTGSPDYAMYKADEEVAKSLLAEWYPVKTEELMEEFKKAYPNKNFNELLCLSNTPGGICRTSALNDENGVMKLFNDNNVEVYNYVTAYTFPFFGGATMNHTGDMAFWFNSVDEVDYLVRGDEENAYKVSKDMSSALNAFLHNDNPSTENLEWKPYTADAHNTMVFDVESECKTDFDKKLYDIIEENNMAFLGQ